MVAMVFCDDARLVPDLDGKTQPAHAHLVDPQLAVVALVLLVLHLGGRTVALQPRRNIP